MDEGRHHPELKVFAFRPVVSTAAERYANLLRDIAQYSEPRGRTLVEKSEEQARCQALFSHRKRLLELRNLSYSEPPAKELQCHSDGGTRCSTASRRQRAFDRLLGRAYMNDAFVFRSTEVRNGTSRPSTACLVSKNQRPQIYFHSEVTAQAHFEVRSISERPHSAAGIRTLGVPSTFMPRQRENRVRPSSASSEFELSAGNLRSRFRHEEAVWSAHLLSEEKALIRSYENIWRLGLIQREFALFGDTSGCEDTSRTETILNELSYTPRVITEVDACLALDALEHAVICVRSNELKGAFRRGLSGSERGNGTLRSLSDASIIHPAALLSLELWNKSNSLQIGSGPKRIRFVHLVSTQCRHSDVPVRRHIPLRQIAAIERFLFLVVRIQSICRGKRAMRLYRGLRASILILQRVGAGFLERRLYVSKLREIKSCVEDESLLAKWATLGP